MTPNLSINLQELYLQPDLKISDLSKTLQSNNNYISQLINAEFGKNFNQFINEYRIREACIHIHEGKHISPSIEGIAGMVGFNNRSSFISAFKKITGVTPSFYIQSINEEQMSEIV